MRIPALVLLAFVGLAACSKPPSDAREFSGTWAFSLGIDTLRLDSAGHYARTNGSPPAVDTGRWLLVNKGKLLTLRSLPRRWPQHGAYDAKLGWHYTDSTRRENVTMSIERSWTGAVKLGVAPEIDWVYTRVPRE